MSKEYSFSINTYDSDGDLVETGVYIHLDNISIKFANSEELEQLLIEISRSLPEIKEAESINIRSKKKN